MYMLKPVRNACGHCVQNAYASLDDSLRELFEKRLDDRVLAPSFDPVAPDIGSVAVQGKVKRLKESVSMLDEVSWDCERTCRGTRFTHLLCTQQVVDFALDSGAKITDVDSRNQPLFTNAAKEQWLESVQDELRDIISNRYEPPHVHPRFVVRTTATQCASARGPTRVRVSASRIHARKKP